MPPIVTAAVEGITDEAVAAKLISHVGGRLVAAYGKRGKQHLIRRLAGYNNAARHSAWFILVDLDHDAPCAPAVLPAWLPAPAPMACLRVAVRAVEAWLMADGEALARYLHIPIKTVPKEPESLDNPKMTMVNLARISRRKDIRDDMMPREGSGRKVGPAYASRMVEYVQTCWRPDIAAQNADSLDKAIERLKHLVEQA